MINVFFVDEHNSSKQNGIGTFRDILLPRLSQYPDINITLVSLNSDCENLKVETYPYGYEYALPFVANGNWRESGNLIWPLLRTYIADNARNLFIFNHSPCAEFIESMKRQFPKSKSIFVIHDQGWCAPLWGSANLLKRVLNNDTIKGIDESTAQYVRDYCNKEHRIYDAVDKVICLSKSTETILKKIYHEPTDKLVRIENGYKTIHSGYTKKDKARKQLGIRNDEELLIFASRPVSHKGIMPLLYAMQILRKKRPYLKCVLAGMINGFSKYWNLGSPIASGLILPGYQTPEQMREWYSAADVGVLSSYTEQCSYSALEMMNSGITIVSSDGNGLCDMFTNGKDSLVVHIDNVLNPKAYGRKLAQAIEKALELSHEQKMALYKGAKHLLRDKYSIDVMAKRYHDLIQKIIP